MGSKAEGGKSFIESVLELVDLVATYLRQQAKLIVSEGVARPLQVAGRKAGLLILAFTLFALASIFLAVGLFLALAYLVGYIIAYLLIGLALVVVGVVVLKQVSR